VQACPNEAIQITLVQKEQVKVFFGTSGCDPKSPLSWLPDSPAADYTLPSTIYRSTRPQAEMRAADHERLRPQPAHWPLIFMLLLTQAGIGGLCLQSFAKPMRLNALLTLSLVSAGLVFSVLHLGQPKKAWRAWLGWRTSWLSREAIVLNLLGAGMFLTLVFRESNLLTMLMAATGLVAVFCQAMVYADTRRQFWALRLTAPRFIGSGAVLGLAMVFAVSATSSLAVALMAVTLLKLSSEATVLKYVHDERWQYGQLRRTALLQTNSLRPILGLRLLLGLVGGVFLPFAAMQSASAGISLTAAVCCFLGELAERYLFFTSVAPDKIPGTVES
jgi:DMSO reductase anchor subunit